MIVLYEFDANYRKLKAGESSSAEKMLCDLLVFILHFKTLRDYINVKRVNENNRLNILS